MTGPPSHPRDPKCGAVAIPIYIGEGVSEGVPVFYILFFFHYIFYLNRYLICTLYINSRLNLGRYLNNSLVFFRNNPHPKLPCHKE